MLEPSTPIDEETNIIVSDAEPQLLRLPLRLGPQIEAGSFSSVYFVSNGKEKSVIKVLQRSRWESFAGNRKTTVPFDNEILCLLQCVHPNIVPLVTSLVTYDAVYIEMPYLPKGDLCKHLMRQGSSLQSLALTDPVPPGPPLSNLLTLGPNIFYPYMTNSIRRCLTAP